MNDYNNTIIYFFFECFDHNCVYITVCVMCIIMCMQESRDFAYGTINIVTYSSTVSLLES